VNNRRHHLSAGRAGLALALFGGAAQAQIVELDAVQVTATRSEQKVDAVPASISVVTDEQMHAHGARDLTSALALVAGVEITPGGDGGPAGSVPALWGLREFDAFLLVVDGVPYGGAFNPQLASLSLDNVERIEVLRGAAPVMYGATSFVGVIQVIHYAPGHTRRHANLAAGSHDSAGAALWTDIGNETLPQSITLSTERHRLSDRSAGFTRNHFLYRLGADLAGGKFALDFDGTGVRQDPNSPSTRAGKILDPQIPIDANHNPSDARLDEHRFQLVGRYSRQTPLGEWNTTFSDAHTRGDFVRGFLAEDYPDAPPSNAEGFRQHRRIDDLYFDTHLVMHPNARWTVSTGFDWLYGRARYANEIFEYSVGLDGSGRPASSSVPVLDEPAGSDTRSFYGVYAQADWQPSERIDVLAGLRLNHTRETMAGEEDVPGGDPVPATARRSKSRASGVLGASFHLWQDGKDSLTLYADARNTYKPAAIDFGPEAEADILQPETATSIELGLKGHVLDGALDWDLSLFSMRFNNLVVAQSVGGLPSLVNAGKETFKGAELELGYRFSDDLRLAAHYTYHDARFGDDVQLFGGVPTQLRGKRLEMSPQHLGGIGITYAPAKGWQASAIANHVGDRFLNKRNTALAGGYTTYDATIGYRFDRCELRLSGRNLGNRRDPVAESELGEAQYYRLPARFVELSLGIDF
jgi:outer membrane receptor protein involved in Fe transport